MIQFTSEVHSSLGTVVGLASSFHWGGRMLLPISMHRHKRLKRSPQLRGSNSGGVTVRTLLKLVNAFDCYACPFLYCLSCVLLIFFNQHLLFANCRTKTALWWKAWSTLIHKAASHSSILTFSHVICFVSGCLGVVTVITAENSSPL